MSFENLPSISSAIVNRRSAYCTKNMFSFLLDYNLIMLSEIILWYEASGPSNSSVIFRSFCEISLVHMHWVFRKGYSRVREWNPPKSKISPEVAENVTSNEKASHTKLWSDPTTCWGHRPFQPGKRKCVTVRQMIQKCCTSQRWMLLGSCIYGMSLMKIDPLSVSYTHLTLPTIYSV